MTYTNKDKEVLGVYCRSTRWGVTMKRVKFFDGIVRLITKPARYGATIVHQCEDCKHRLACLVEPLAPRKFEARE